MAIKFFFLISVMKFIIFSTILAIVVVMVSGGCNPVDQKAIACEGYNLIISCPPPRVIRVQTAIWGRLNNVTCGVDDCRSINPTWPSDRCPNYVNGDLNCRSTTSELCARQKCDGQQSCIFRATASTFNNSNPCTTTYKYAIVTYRCDY